MSDPNLPPLDQAIEETIDLAQQAIEQARAEIARSQALSQAEADLARSIECLAGEHDSLTDGE